MNQKGQVMILGIMLFAMAFLVATLVIQPLLTQATDTRTLIGCEYDNMTQAVYISCVAIDIFPGLFFATVIVGGIGLIIANKGGGA